MEKEADDEEYSPRPFTMEELNARTDQTEAEIAAGKVIGDEDVWRELEEEFAREDAEGQPRAEGPGLANRIVDRHFHALQYPLKFRMEFWRFFVPF